MQIDATAGDWDAAGAPGTRGPVGLVVCEKPDRDADRSAPVRRLSAEVLTVWSQAREHVYTQLLAAGHARCWTVRQMAEGMPDSVSAGTVRTILYLLLGDSVLELVPRQRTLTLRLAGDGAAILAELMAQWQPVKTGGQLRTAASAGGRR